MGAGTGRGSGAQIRSRMASMMSRIAPCLGASSLRVRRLWARLDPGGARASPGRCGPRARPGAAQRATGVPAGCAPRTHRPSRGPSRRPGIETHGRRTPGARPTATAPRRSRRTSRTDSPCRTSATSPQPRGQAPTRRCRSCACRYLSSSFCLPPLTSGSRGVKRAPRRAGASPRRPHRHDLLMREGHAPLATRAGVGLCPTPRSGVRAQPRRR